MTRSDRLAMYDRSSFTRHAASLVVAAVLGVVSIGAQGRAAAPVAGVLQQVRVALGHGDLAGARQILGAPQGDASMRAVATALVEMFEGKYADARARLAPVAAAAPAGEGALELGWLEIKMGDRAAGRQRLDPLTRVDTSAIRAPDDWFRFARAARGIGEYKLAYDVYTQKLDKIPRADIETELGDMLLQRHQPGDAVTAYTLALEADPKWVAAEIGIARAFADEDPKKSAAALAEAVKLAPEYPDLLVAIAEQRIDNDDLKTARETLDALARVKPGTVEEAAERAVIAYKEGGVAAADAAAAKVTAIQSNSGLGYRLASERASGDYRFDDSAALAQKATEVDPDDGAAFLDLGLARLRVGDEATGRTALDRSWDLDASVAVTKNLLDLLDHLDTFEVVTHNDFIFKFAKNEAPVLKVYALPLADEAYRQYQQRYGLTPKGPILIEVFTTHDDFAVRTFGLQGMSGALGACFGRVVTMDSPSARPQGDFSWQATLWHELAHVFSLQLSDSRVPRWLTEGISVYEEHRRNPAWGRELSLEFAHNLSKGQTFGVKKLPDAFKNPETLSFAYFEAALVVEHLVDLNGEAGLRKLLLAYANGAKDTEAFQTAFGRSIDDVETSFAAYVNKEFGSLRDAMRDPPRAVDRDDLAGLKARAAEAPGNYISQMELAGALLKQRDVDAAKPVLERAAALAPQAQGESSPRSLLAGLLVPTDPDRARVLLRQLLTYDHENIAAARELAALAAKANAPADEDFALRLIADLDPFDADVHGSLGARLMAAGDYPAARTEFEAALALGPANPAEAHANLGGALLKLGQRDDARREALAALKTAPMYERAQDLLVAASGR